MGASPEQHLQYRKDEPVRLEYTPTTLTPEIIFPDECIVGSLGDAARIIAEGTEIPAEGIFTALLTHFAAACSGNLKLKARLFKDTRLYSVLLATSATGKKSSSNNEAEKFFSEVKKLMPLSTDKLDQSNILTSVAIRRGVGSGEGLGRVLSESARTILIYDELKGLSDKANIEGSSLLAAITQLYEHDSWENSVKSKKESLTITNASLSLIGCATIETYETLFSGEAIRIGFPNRLFVATLRRKPKVAISPYPDEAKLALARDMVVGQLMMMRDKPLELSFSIEGQKLFCEWYENLPETIQARRLDVLAYRMMPVFALICDKTEVDAETVATVCKLMTYEYHVRMEHDPVDADSGAARMEIKIMNVLKTYSSLSKRELEQKVNARRSGYAVYESALSALQRNGRILMKKDGNKRFIIQRAEEE